MLMILYGPQLWQPSFTTDNFSRLYFTCARYLTMSPTCIIGSSLYKFMHSQYAVQCCYVRNCSMEMEKL